jgi:hypothetical protein
MTRSSTRHEGCGQWWAPLCLYDGSEVAGPWLAAHMRATKVMCFFSLLRVVSVRFEPKTKLKKPTLNLLVPCAVTNRSARGFRRPKFLKTEETELRTCICRHKTVNKTRTRPGQHCGPNRTGAAASGRFTLCPKGPKLVSKNWAQVAIKPAALGPDRSVSASN